MLQRKSIKISEICSIFSIFLLVAPLHVLKWRIIWHRKTIAGDCKKHWSIKITENCPNRAAEDLCDCVQTWTVELAWFKPVFTCFLILILLIAFLHQFLMVLWLDLFSLFFGKLLEADLKKCAFWRFRGR